MKMKELYMKHLGLLLIFHIQVKKTLKTLFSNLIKDKNKQLFAKDKNLNSLVGRLNTQNKSIRENCAKTIFHLSIHKGSRNSLLNSKVVPALEELQEDADNNLSQLAYNIMNHFDYLSDYKPTLKDMQDKKRNLLKNYILPFCAVIVDETKNEKLSININWDHYQISDNTKRRTIIHLYKR